MSKDLDRRVQQDYQNKELCKPELITSLEDSCDDEKRKDEPVKKSLREDEEWDYVDSTLDEQLEIEKQNLEASTTNTTRTLKVIKGGEPKRLSTNQFRTRITIGADSSKVELLGVTGNGAGCEGFQGISNGSGTDEEGLENCESLPELTSHPNTIKKYVQAMLAFFSNLRIEHIADGKVYDRKLPVFYGSREKLVSIEEHEFAELMNGNTNYLPRASLLLEAMTYDNQRQQNKNNIVSRELTLSSLANNSAFAYTQSAPSPYNISVRLNIVTRGMSDALMLVEQVSSFFNPYYTINIIEQHQESNVRLQLEGVNFEHPEIDQYSNNEFMTEFSFILYGNMYKPRSKEYIINTISVNI